MFVAFLRALADSGLSRVQGYSDPIAAQILPPFWSKLLQLIAPRMQALPPDKRAKAMAQLEVMPLRVRAIDVELERAVIDGCEQVVILGAGFDTRAHRMPVLRRTRVFEVDHPASQQLKRKHAADVPVLARELAYVTVDFERESLAEALRAAGHQPEQRTAWVWEGVVMYLSEAALRSSLRAIASASSPGSVLIVNYHEPETSVGVTALRKVIFGVLGEPQIGVRSRESMRAEIEAAGFELVSDTGTAEWAQAYAPQLQVAGVGFVARLAVARRARS
jgi:methyltransferase (TIGR00027 family)